LRHLVGQRARIGAEHQQEAIRTRDHNVFRRNALGDEVACDLLHLLAPLLPALAILGANVP
jgi:hypothetical protein